MYKNIDPKQNPVTSYTGLLFIIVGIVLFAAPIFVTTKQAIEVYYPAAAVIIGLSLLLIPDDLKGALRNLINKKSDT